GEKFAPADSGGDADRSWHLNYFCQFFHECTWFENDLAETGRADRTQFMIFVDRLLQNWRIAQAPVHCSRRANSGAMISCHRLIASQLRPFIATSIIDRQKPSSRMDL